MALRSPFLGARYLFSKKNAAQRPPVCFAQTYRITASITAPACAHTALSFTKFTLLVNLLQSAWKYPDTIQIHTYVYLRTNRSGKCKADIYMGYGAYLWRIQIWYSSSYMAALDGRQNRWLKIVFWYKYNLLSIPKAEGILYSCHRHKSKFSIRVRVSRVVHTLVRRPVRFKIEKFNMHPNKP